VTVADLRGHANPTITLKMYGQLSRRDGSRARAAWARSDPALMGMRGQYGQQGDS
jgi:hypothetical protein